MKRLTVLLFVAAALFIGCAQRQTALEPRSTARGQSEPVPLDALEPAEPGPRSASLSPRDEPRDTPEPVAADDSGSDDSAYDDPGYEGSAERRAAPPDDEILAPRERAAGRVHIVIRGDTLYGLAGYYYGDGRRWREIYDANRDRIDSPNVLPVGTKLIIP